MKRLNPVNKYVSNVELEKGEVLQRDNGGIPEFSEIGGKPHSKGGTPAQLRPEDRVFSSKIKLPDYLVESITGMKKKESPANLAKKYNIDKYVDILENSKDELSKNSAKLMLAKHNAILDSIFNAQELFKESRGVKNGVLLKDQGLNSDLEPIGQMGGEFQTGGRKPFIVPDFFTNTGVKVGEYTDENIYLPLYQAPDKFSLDANGKPLNTNFWEKKPKGWFTKPEYNKDILKEYADITGYDLENNQYKTDTRSMQLRKALAFRPGNKNVTKTYSDSYIPVIGERDNKGNFTPVGKVSTGATKFANSTYDNLPVYTKDSNYDKYDVEFFPAKGVNSSVKNAFVDKSNLPNYDDIQSVSKILPIDRPRVQELDKLPSKFEQWKATHPDTPSNPGTTTSSTSVENKTSTVPTGIPNDIAELIGFRTEQRNKQANLLSAIMSRPAPPVYTNPQSPIINERFLPINDLAAERSVNNARDTMLNSDLPSQYVNALSGDLTAKGIEASGKVDLHNYQGYVQTQNRNNNNLQNTIYKNRVNDEEAKRKYVSDWQTVLDQRDKEIQDRIYDYQNLNERKDQTSDDATLQEHLYRAANKRFIPKTVVNKNGTVTYQYVANPNWSPTENKSTWFSNNNAQLDQIANTLKRYSPEEQKNIIEYLKVLKNK